MSSFDVSAVAIGFLMPDVEFSGPTLAAGPLERLVGRLVPSSALVREPRCIKLLLSRR